MKKYIFYSLLLINLYSNAQLPLPNFWMVNSGGRVNTVIKHGNTVYIGGTFNYVGPNSAYGTAIGKNSVVPQMSFARPNGAVLCCIPDGSGGFYIGGRFTKVGDKPRQNIARINADGSVSNWTTSADADVKCLVLYNGVLYAGGLFSNMGGQYRIRVAAVDTATGLATSWNPTVDYPFNFPQVYSMAASNNTIYIGGFFSMVGGQFRINVAGINATTGQVAPFNPYPYVDNLVYSVAVSGNTLYIGGKFSNIGGQTRNRLAALDAATGAVTSWNPNANNEVNVIKSNGKTVFVGGLFTTIGGQARVGLAAVDSANGLVTSWNANTNSSGYVTDLTLSGRQLYVSGSFLNMGGVNCRNLISLDTITALAGSWNPYTDGIPKIAVSDTLVYVGGAVSVGYLPRNALAALNATTGQATSWTPVQLGVVNALVAINSKVYVAGQLYNYIGGVQQYLFALDSVTGSLTSWVPNCNNTVNKLAVSGNKLFIAGQFTSIGGQTRYGLAAIDTTTGNVTPWSPSLDAYYGVTALEVYKNKIYISGLFHNINNQPRNGVAAVDTVTGALSPWAPVLTPFTSGTSVYANALKADRGVIYLGGNFSFVGGQARGGLAAVDTSLGLPTSWNPNVVTSVSSLDIAGDNLYVGNTAGSGNSRLMAFNVNTGVQLSWGPLTYKPEPRTSFSVLALVATPSTIYAGGDFSTTEDGYRPNFAAFSTAEVPLPYRDIPLNVQKRNDGVNIFWTCTFNSEVNSYVVEKSLDGQQFTRINSLLPNSISSYQYVDGNSGLKDIYYRIKATLKNGALYYSKVVKISLRGNQEITVYPNPIIGNNLSVQFNNVAAGKYFLSFYNLNGQLLFLKTVLHSGGSSTYTFEIGRLSKGSYITKLTDNSLKLISTNRWLKL